MWKYRIFLENKSEITETDLRIYSRGLHRTVINWFDSQDHELTNKIKEANTFRPFNITFLRYDREKQMYFFEVCISDEKLGLDKLLESAMQSSLNSEIDLNYSKFNFKSWNPVISKNYFDLLEIVTKKREQKLIKVEFISETLFTKKYQHNTKADYPLPDPELFFESVLNRWNTFCITKFPIDEVMEYVKENVCISEANIRTDTFSIGYANKKPIIMTGFKGYIVLRQLSDDPSWNSIIKTLALYSSWSGAGKKSAFGLGQTKVTFFNP